MNGFPEQEVQSRALDEYRNALEAWYECEGDLNNRPELNIAVLSGSDLADISVADLSTFSAANVRGLANDEDLLGGINDDVRRILKEVHNEFSADMPATLPLSPRIALHQNVLGWLDRVRQRLAIVDESIGTLPGEESPFAAQWRAESASRQTMSHADAMPKHEPVRGKWVFSEEALRLPQDEPVTGSTRDTFANLDAAIEAAKVNLRQIASDRMRTQATSEERRRLAAKLDTVVNDVERSGRKMSQTVWFLAREAPIAVEGVVKTIEDARRNARENGQSISDQEVYAAYQRAVERAGRENVAPELWLGFCIVHALMDGDPNGRLPYSL